MDSAEPPAPWGEAFHITRDLHSPGGSLSSSDTSKMTRGLAQKNRYHLLRDFLAIVI